MMQERRKNFDDNVERIVKLEVVLDRLDITLDKTLTLLEVYESRISKLERDKAKVIGGVGVISALLGAYLSDKFKITFY